MQYVLNKHTYQINEWAAAKGSLCKPRVRSKWDDTSKSWWLYILPKFSGGGEATIDILPMVVTDLFQDMGFRVFVRDHPDVTRNFSHGSLIGSNIFLRSTHNAELRAFFKKTVPKNTALVVLLLGIRHLGLHLCWTGAWWLSCFGNGCNVPREAFCRFWEWQWPLHCLFSFCLNWICPFC